MEFVCLRNISIKDEPVDYTDNIESSEVMIESEERTIVDVDPMNLLEAIAERCSEDDQEVVKVTSNGEDVGLSDKWKNWIRTYHWLLRRTEDKRLGFCLYCGKNLNVESACSLQRHDGAMIHKERQRNYEEFLHSCKEAFNEDGLSAIKNEIDDFNAQRISTELIRKRLERSKDLNDFNWTNWLKAHSWLVRQNHAEEFGTKGYCKYCNCVFDVEFSLNRQRHENSVKHQLSEKMFFNKTVNGENGINLGEICENGFEGAEYVEIDENNIRMDNRAKNKMLKGRLFDKVANSSKQRCCRICKVVMDKHSCRKHLKTKLHKKNMHAFAYSARKDKTNKGSVNDNMPIDWSKYTKFHKWICADPDDPKYAYCSYCEKRFMYGLSTVKKNLHEKSQSHCEAVKRKLINGTLNSELENQAETGQLNEVDSVNFDADESDRSTVDNVLKRKRAVYTDEWFEINPCYERNQDDEDYIYCKCCKVQLLIKNLNIGKHERAERHRFSKNAYIQNTKREKLDSSLEEHRESVVNIPWMRRTKNGQTYCKYCRVVISNQYKPALHEKTERHKFATQKFLARRNMLLAEGDVMKTERHQFNATQDEGGVSEEEVKPVMYAGGSPQNWQKQYVWLTFIETESREHYGYCNYCKQSVFVPTNKFASKHECTAMHIRAHLTRQNEIGASQNSKTEDTLMQNNANGKFKLYKWLLADPEGNRSFGYCKYCKTRVMTEGLLALAHHNSRSHRKATNGYLQNPDNEIAEEDNQSHALDDRIHPTMESINPDESGSETSLATRLTNAHTEMLNLIREMRGNKTRQNMTILSGPLSAAASLSPSDADICYSRVSEQRNGKLEFNVLSQAKRERNTYDLFFESMNETVKRLPSDLAAESRIKIMQIVYDLEMRALQRNPQSTQSPNTTPLSSRSTLAMRERSASVTKPNSDSIIPDNNEQSTNQTNQSVTSDAQ
nr:protein suppressor of variegation 3-7 [Bactrocera oleae]XP_036217032.1 protein suppressor of variegation 3-7 [Bactrocera oleae]